MNLTAFENKLCTWTEPMKPFIESEECDKIYAWLKETAKVDRILPNSDDTFKAFEKCPIDKARVVIMGMEPYASVKRGIVVADGVAFSCSNTGELQPSLSKFYEGIQDDVFGGTTIKIEKPADLSYLCEEGVLLLNSSLTVSENKITSHQGIWDPFMKFLIEQVLSSKENLVYILMGREAQRWEAYTNPFNSYCFTCEHPSAAAREKRAWQHNHVFTSCNALLRSKGEREIYWDKLPF